MELYGSFVPLWQLASAIGLFLCIAEIFVSGFHLLPIGIAFFLTSAFSYFMPDLVPSLIFLAGSSLVVYWVFSKYFKPKEGEVKKSNFDSLVGKEGRVSEAIAADGSAGYVKVYGDSWRAISADGTAISEGTPVRITKTDGNKVYVVLKENS